jgi:uncharacterized RDD family membrane protein YckC
MTYYYAVNGQQTGPVEEEQLRGMVSSGAISADTLVWREGMPQWQPYSSALGIAEVGQATVQCSVCHQVFPVDQTIQYGTQRVCAGCKPKFLQSIREGAQTFAAFEIAGSGARIGAKILDRIILYILESAVTYTVASAFVDTLKRGAAAGPGQPGFVAAVAVVVLTGMLVRIVYQAAFLKWRGQTPGKMLLKTKVVNPDGSPIGWGKAIGRPLAEILSGCIVWIGYIIAFFDDEKRTLHDRICGTRVIRVE